MVRGLLFIEIVSDRNVLRTFLLLVLTTTLEVGTLRAGLRRKLFLLWLRAGSHKCDVMLGFLNKA